MKILCSTIPYGYAIIRCKNSSKGDYTAWGHNNEDSGILGPVYGSYHVIGEAQSRHRLSRRHHIVCVSNLTSEELMGPAGNCFMIIVNFICDEVIVVITITSCITTTSHCYSS